MNPKLMANATSWQVFTKTLESLYTASLALVKSVVLSTVRDVCTQAMQHVDAKPIGNALDKVLKIGKDKAMIKALTELATCKEYAEVYTSHAAILAMGRLTQIADDIFKASFWLFF